MTINLNDLLVLMDEANTNLTNEAASVIRTQFAEVEVLRQELTDCQAMLYAATARAKETA